MRISRLFVKFVFTALLICSSIGIAVAQDLQQHVTYVCNGQREFIENCNMRDLSDASTCYVGHPDHILANGMMAYTTETRATLKKLFPSCKQPSADEIAHAKAFEKKQADLQAAAEKKANDQLTAATQPAPANYGQPQKPKTPEERAMTRCITSGRLPASCTGNTLLSAFSDMVSQVLPSAAKEPPTGPIMAGVFQGAGDWRLDFIDGGVLVNCSFLSPNQQSYTIEFKGNQTAIIVDTTPKPLVLTLKADGTIAGPGPLKIDGVVASGYTEGDRGSSYSGGYHNKYGAAITNSEAVSSGEAYDSGGNRVYGATDSGGTPGHTTFSPRTATCPAPNLSSKGAGVGVQTMQTDLLKTMFGGEKGPPTPPGIRMHGIFAASTGFSVQFFPESAILGCGPDAARAYPYTVVADGTKAVIQIAAPDHPLSLAFKPDGSLDPGGSGSYQVHGRTVIGLNDDGDFTFAPLEQACNLAVLTPSKAIPSGGGSAATMTASAGGASPGAAGAPTLSMPNAPLGNAVLTIISGFPAQPNVAVPLANYPYVLLRNSFADAVTKASVPVPAGMSAVKAYGTACANRTPDCQQFGAVWKADAISAARADATGKAILPGVPAGTYYLAISVRYNNQPIIWDMKVNLKAGVNSVTLDPRNAAPVK
jgi:hypothetical protein